ncbi:hypothetical protein K469DRAFT_132329 [Zopfia rhizophila CBS 207.26]|uniref:Uncharacterized protein n=1 Tax=Zopfia rhizophila CBS 207.26 TaxID=1314779 RepID=A0A6A6EX61_9PEZI|nr:hypothetical protein K469DRAFT_132329 [Zopfia rhizophila CBS 207.26]
MENDNNYASATEIEKGQSLDDGDHKQNKLKTGTVLKSWLIKTLPSWLPRPSQSHPLRIKLWAPHILSLLCALIFLWILKFAYELLLCVSISMAKYVVVLVLGYFAAVAVCGFVRGLTYLH